MPPRKKGQARKAQQPVSQAVVPSADTTAKQDELEQPKMDLHIQDSRSGLFHDIEKYPEVQREVFTALQAIYPEGFERVHGRTEAWQREENLTFSVKLFPLDQTEYYLILEIEFPKDFPKVGPKLGVTELQPAGDVYLSSAIAGHITECSAFWKGNADSIHETVSQIADLLGNTAQSRAAKRTEYSLEEERAKKELAAQKMARQQEEIKARQRLEIRQKAEEQFQQEINTVREHRGKLQVTEASEMTSSSLEALILHSFDKDLLIKDLDDNNVYHFKSVAIATTILDRTDKKVTSVLPIIEDRKRYPLLLKKDIFLPDNLATKDELRAKLTEIEAVLDSTKQYRHANVIELIGYQINHIELGSGGGGEWQLNILSEYANKGSLSEFLDIATTLDAAKVKSWTIQVIEALEFFDSSGFVHPAIHLGNILLCLSPRGETTIKVADGYGTALRSLVMQSQGRDPVLETVQTPWTAPELSKSGATRTSKASIWDLGVVMLQMIFGKQLQQEYGSPRLCIDDNYFSSSFARMIQCLFEPKPHARPTAFRLRGERFFQDEQEQIWTLSPKKQGTRSKKVAKDTHASSTRWQTDWEVAEKSELGAGGFGRVVKARYKFDGQVYAVKKVQCRSERQYSEVFGEVAVIAKLNHPCVVRYYGAWFEEKIESRNDATHEQENSHQQYPRNISSLAPNMSTKGHDFFDISLDRPIGPEFSHDSFFRRSNIDSILQTKDLRDSQNPFAEVDDPVDLNKDSENDSGNMFAYQKPGVDESDSMDQTTSASYSAMHGQHRNVDISRTPSRSSEGVLYIQMEYCEGRSLTNKIHDGLWGNEQELWRIFRLILDGMKHIHDHRIVHRDIKPDNIFVDSAGNPKIGDFGLATPGVNPVADSDSKTTYTASRGIGTKFYTAPELEVSGSGAYSTKADMYSLGMVLFDMSYPTKSTSERVSNLSRLAEKDHRLPSDFFKYAKDAQANLILRLINHDQHARPSVAELLEDPTIPKYQYETHELSKYLEKVSAESPEQFMNLFQEHYSKRNAMSLDRTWEITAGESLQGVDQALLVSIERKLEDVFRRHGAVRSSRLSMFPKSDYYDDAAIFIDPSGLVCQLAYDFTLPHARRIASTPPLHTKTYCVGPVFRKSRNTGEEPRAIVEADFDIVTSSAENNILKDAETLKVLDEVLEAFPALQRKAWIIYLNHNELLDLVLEYCRIEPAAWTAVKSNLSRLHAASMSLVQVRDDLRNVHNVRETSLTDLAKFYFTGSVEQVLAKMQKLLHKTPYLERVNELLTGLKGLTQLAVRMGVSTAVEVAPLINHSQQLHHEDLMILCLEKSSKAVIATGGRYDALVAEFKTGTSSPRAVGLRFGLARMATLIGEEQAKVRCDVLVTSFDKEALAGSCIDLVTSLWAEDVSAEVSDTTVSTEELLGGASQYMMVVLVRRGGIKVRNMRKGGEENEVGAGDLAGFVKSELTGRRKRK